MCESTAKPNVKAPKAQFEADVQADNQDAENHLVERLTKWAKETWHTFDERVHSQVGGHDSIIALQMQAHGDIRVIERNTGKVLFSGLDFQNDTTTRNAAKVYFDPYPPVYVKGWYRPGTTGTMLRHKIGNQVEVSYIGEQQGASDVYVGDVLAA